MCTLLPENSIPIYPVFRRLKLGDKDLIERFLSNFEPYCDFRFWAMWHRDIEEVWGISSLFDHLLIRFADHITGASLYSVVGANENTTNTIVAMLSLLSKDTLYPKLSMVPEETVNAISKENKKFLNISLDNSNVDYVYSVKQIIDLKGKIMKNKKREIVKYWKHYPDSTIRQINLNSEADVDMMRALTNKWAKKRKGGDHRREVDTMTRLLRTRENRENLYTVGLFNNNRLIGFTINEPFNDKWYSGYFGKADPSYSGASSVLEHETAKTFYAKGFTYANLEQDLGIPGLRKTKRLWRPIRMLNKYTIKPRWTSGLEYMNMWNRT